MSGNPPLTASAANRLELLYRQGQLCVKEQDYYQAIAWFTQCCELAPGNRTLLSVLASVLYAVNNIEAALRVYQQVLAQAPQDPVILNEMGNCYLAKGEPETATAHFTRALENAPGSAGIMYNLARVGRYAPTAPLMERLQRHYHSPECVKQDRVLVCFALARIYESHGDHRLAFRYYAEANAGQFSLGHYDEAMEFTLFDAMKNTFTGELFRQLSGCGFPDSCPIFVVGLPRSGTSLVEQILASHTGVIGVGEVPVLPWIANRLIPQTFGPFPFVIQKLEAHVFADLGKLYMSMLGTHCPDRFNRVVAKTINNHFLVGFIRLILPNARIVHCVRDPMDTCWSLFRHHFPEAGYSYDQQALGRYYRRYQGLMDHWQQLLPGIIHEVRYEELIARPEATIRSLLAYCNLPWEERCLNFYETRRVVNTASTLQVRQPLYRDSIGSWRTVANELAPLQAALKEAF